MIFKSDLVDAINSLSHDLTDLAIKVSNLQKEIDSLKVERIKVNIISSKDNSSRSLKNIQPRDKSGKFTKK